MTKYIIILFLIFNITTGSNCQTKNPKPTATRYTESNEKLNNLDKSFDVNIEIEKVNESEYTLITTIELFNDSYVISPLKMFHS